MKAKLETLPEEDEMTVLQRSRTALQSIAERTKNGPIDEKTKKMCFMYCRNIVREGVQLKDSELELLARSIAYGQGNIDYNSIKFIGMEYAKKEDLTPAIEMLNKCIKTHGEDEKLESIKKIMIGLQKQQERSSNNKKNQEEER